MSTKIDIPLKDLRPAMVFLCKVKKMRRNKIAELFNTRPQTVSAAIKRYEEQGDFEDKPRSGRPKTATDEVHVQQIEEELANDDRTSANSTRRLGRKLGVSKDSVFRVLKKKGYRAWKGQKRQRLSEDAKKKRQRRCKKLLRRCADDGHRRILFSDEKLFSIEEAFNV